MKRPFRTPGTVVISVLLLLLIATGIANAAATIGSAEIKDDSIQSVDVKSNTLGSADIKEAAVGTSEIVDNGVKEPDLAANSVGSSEIIDQSILPQDLSAAAKTDLTAVSGPNWAIVDRNVIGNGDSFLRTGPVLGPGLGVPRVRPPAGVGSLGIRTGSGADKAAFGNQVDFIGDTITAASAPRYSAFTEAENQEAAPNLPGVMFEIDPNLTDVPAQFTSLVFTPVRDPVGWTPLDTSVPADGLWGFTNDAVGAATGCDLNGPRCSWAEIVDQLNDGGDPAVVGTLQFTKGRDFEYSGAVDALVYNGTMYDFEPNGVFETPAP